MLPKGVHFILDEMMDSCLIEGDEAQIQQALMNILTSAGEASTAPSKINIALRLDANKQILL
jgi:signal transduction histidine kinase